MQSLRESGLSIRAIAAATGHSVGTVHDSLGSGVQNRTAEPEPAADNLAEVEAVKRRLEVRIGELLGPAEVGGDRKSDQVRHAEPDLTKQQRHDFRQMAENANGRPSVGRPLCVVVPAVTPA